MSVTDASCENYIVFAKFTYGNRRNIFITYHLFLSSVDFIELKITQISHHLSVELNLS